MNASITAREDHVMFWPQTKVHPVLGMSKYKIKKVYFVRFLTDGDENEYSSSRGLDMPAMARTSRTQTKQQTFISQPPKSITISTLLKAGKLITEERTQTISLQLEEFDVEESAWINNSHTYYMRLENKHFGEGGFRLAHKAFEIKSDEITIWVV